MLVSPQEYEELLEQRRERAREELRDRLVAVQERVAEAGLDVGIVDEAIDAARAVR